MADGNGSIGTGKATAGSAGGAAGVGLGGAVAALVISLWWPHADPATAVNLSTVFNAVIGAAGAYLAAYLTPHGG